MRTLAQLPSETSSERVSRIWGGIVQFANADLAVDKHAFEDFIELLARCTYKTHHFRPAGRSAHRLPSAFEVALDTYIDTYIEKVTERECIIKRANIEVPRLYRGWDQQALKLLTIKCHKDFTHMVTWLCAPDKHPELASKAVLFLEKNLRQTTVYLVNTTARLYKGSGDHPIFYLRSDDYDSIMSPICEFIFRRIERYHDGELELREAVPIQICERADCGKFLLPERTGRKRYCSDNCRVRAYQMQMDWAAHMRRYREEAKADLKRRKR